MKEEMGGGIDHSRSVSSSAGPSNFSPSPPFLFCPTLVAFLFWCSPSSSLLIPSSLCVCFVSQCSRTPPSLTVWMLPASVQSSALQFCYTEHKASDVCIKKRPSAVSGTSQEEPGGLYYSAGWSVPFLLQLGRMRGR